MCNFFCGENRCWWIVIAALVLMLLEGCGCDGGCGCNHGGCGGCGGGCCPQ